MLPNYPPSAWLERENWPFPVMVDSAGGTAAQAYGLPSYPYFVFTDAQGAVVGRAVGEIAPSDLQKILTALEAGNPLPTGIAGASSPPDHHHATGVSCGRSLYGPSR